MMPPSIPSWCQPQGWVYHIPSNTVFQAHRLQVDRTTSTLYLQDSHNQDYPVADCQPLTPRTLTAPAALAGTAIQISPHPRGLLLTHGPIQKLVQIPPISQTPDDAAQAAASLAKIFNGTIYTEAL